MNYRQKVCGGLTNLPFLGDSAMWCYSQQMVWEFFPLPCFMALTHRNRDIHMLHEASQVGFTSLNISYLKYGHLTCAKRRGFLYNHGGRQVSWHGDSSCLLWRWLFPWTKGHLAVYPGVPPHLRQQKPSEMSHTQATLPAGLLSLHATLLTPPCPCLFRRCFPDGSCHSSFVQHHVWPQKGLSVKPPQGSGSAPPGPRGHSRVLGCRCLHRPRQAPPGWSQSTWKFSLGGLSLFSWWFWHD